MKPQCVIIQMRAIGVKLSCGTVYYIVKDSFVDETAECDHLNES